MVGFKGDSSTISPTPRRLFGSRILGRRRRSPPHAVVRPEIRRVHRERGVRVSAIVNFIVTEG